MFLIRLHALKMAFRRLKNSFVHILHNFVVVAVFNMLVPVIADRQIRQLHYSIGYSPSPHKELNDLYPFFGKIKKIIHLCFSSLTYL